MIGHINFDAKIIGKRSAGKLHAAFDEEGDGNVDQIANAPLLDPTITERKIIFVCAANNYSHIRTVANIKNIFIYADNYFIYRQTF